MFKKCVQPVSTTLYNQWAFVHSSYKLVIQSFKTMVKVSSLHTFVPTLSSVSSPAFFRDFNLLYSQLYPVSTAPTIMKNKEK